MSLQSTKLGKAYLLSLLLVASMQGPSFAADHLSQGLSYYNKGEYLNSLHELMAAVQSNPKNATAHYYLANCLNYLNQQDSAMEEYKEAYSLSPPHSQMANYCMEALTASQQPAPEDQQQAVRQMVSQIRNQVDSKERGIQDEAAARQSDAGRLSAAQSQTYQERLARDIALINQGRTLGGRRGAVQSINRAIATANAQAQADQDNQTAQANYYLSSAAAQSEGNTKMVNVEDAAANLESQFLHPTGGVQLNPLGTNLYVQNYSYSSGDYAPPVAYPAQSLPPPAGARAKQLVLKNGKPYFTPAVSASGGRKTTTSVHGQVVDP